MTETNKYKENLLSVPTKFINRKREKEQLERALSDPAIQSVAIYGVGGIGKTVLAHFVVSEPKIDEQFPGGIIWVNCNTEDSLPKILETLASTLDIGTASLTPGAVRDAVISKLRLQAALIVFDDYERVVQNDEVLSFIGRLPKLTKALIISRDRVRIPNRNIPIRLEGLTESEAIKFLKQRLEPKQLSNMDQVVLQDISRLSGGIPLVLEVIAGLLKQGNSPAEVIRKVKNPRSVTIEDLFKKTISALPELQRKFIEAISVFAHPAEGEAIATVAEIEDWRLSANALAQKSLVEVVGTKYALHPLVRTYLRSQLSPESLSALQQLMVQYFLTYVKEYQSNFEQLDREWLNIQYSIETAYNNELWQDFVEFVLTIAQFLNARGYESEYQQWLSRAIECSDKLGDTGIRAALLYNLGIQYQQLGEILAALDAYQESLRCTRELDNIAAESAILGNLGLAYQNLGEIDKAIAFYQQALTICRQINNRLGEAYQLRNLGLVYAEIRDFELAIAYYYQALEISRIIRDQNVEANLLTNLGIAYSGRIISERAQNIEQAIAYYYQALEISRIIGDRNVEANLLTNLGSAYSDRIIGERAQNVEQAITYYYQALEISRIIGNRQAEANLLTNLGIAYSDRIIGERAQNVEQAIAAYQSALSVYTREAFPYNWATIQQNLGSAYRTRIKGERAQNVEQAIAAYQSALSVYTRQEFPQDWAATKSNLGNAYSDQIRGDKAENVEQAIAAYESALSVYTRQEFPYNWATILQNLGSAYLTRIKGERAQNVEYAIAAYQSALSVYIREEFPQDWAATQSNLGNAYSQRKLGDSMENLRIATSSYELALQVYTKENFPRDWLRVTTNLSTAYAEMGNWSKAKKMATTVLQAFRGAIADAESVESLTPWYQKFGELAMQNNDPQAAIHIFAEAAYRFELQGLKVPDDICNKLNELREVLGEEHYSITWAEVQGILTPLLAQTLHDARHLMHEEQFSEAFDKLSSALERLSETKDTKLLCKQRATILFLRGFCLRKQGEWNVSIKEQEQSFELFEKIKDFFNTARVLLEKGHLYELMNNYEDARISYMDAYHHSRRAKDKNGMASASEHLGRIEYRVRMFPQAVKNLEEARKLYISLGKHTKASAIQSDIEDAKAALIYQKNKNTT
jgi:tetratricopeptide (TPR) repeat protein